MAVEDVADGFVVTPSPKYAAMRRGLAIGLVSGWLAIAVIFAALSAFSGEPAFLWVGAVCLLVMAAGDWALWLGIRPPVLKADSMIVSYSWFFRTQHVARTELATIRKGETLGARRSAARVPSYAFGIENGKVAFTIQGLMFRSEDIEEFGRRLGVGCSIGVQNEG
jgi:hypothetical protein